MQMIIKFIGIIFSLIGVIMKYDARILTMKFFGFGDQNEGSLGMKMTGFILATIGGLMVVLNL